MTDNKALSYGSIDIASKSPKHRTSLGLSSFSGQMQQLIINGKSYFELINNGDLGISVNKTISFSRADLPHKYPINIKNNKSWLKLPKIEAFHILIVQFHFKTKEENGLILYNSGQNSDYIAVEMVDGQIHYMFSLGKEKILIKSKSPVTTPKRTPLKSFNFLREPLFSVMPEQLKLPSISTSPVFSLRDHLPLVNLFKN